MTNPGKRGMPGAIEKPADPHVFAIEARLDEQRDALGREELEDLDLLLEHLLQSCSSSQSDFGAPVGRGRRIDGPSCFFSSSSVRAASPPAESRCPPARAGRSSRWRRAACRGIVEVVLRLHLDDDRCAGERRRNRRRPGPRIAGDPHVLRFGHLNRRALERPAAADRAVRFERRVRQAPAREPIARPLARLPQRGRPVSRGPWTSLSQLSVSMTADR